MAAGGRGSPSRHPSPFVLLRSPPVGDFLPREGRHRAGGSAGAEAAAGQCHAGLASRHTAAAPCKNQGSGARRDEQTSRGNGGNGSRAGTGLAEPGDREDVGGQCAVREGSVARARRQPTQPDLAGPRWRMVDAGISPGGARDHGLNEARAMRRADQNGVEHRLRTGRPMSTLAVQAAVCGCTPRRWVWQSSGRSARLPPRSGSGRGAGLPRRVSSGCGATRARQHP